MFIVELALKVSHLDDEPMQTSHAAAELFQTLSQHADRSHAGAVLQKHCRPEPIAHKSTQQSYSQPEALMHRVPGSLLQPAPPIHLSKGHHVTPMHQAS